MVYAPGYITDRGFNEKAMHALTGFSLRAHNEAMEAELEISNTDHAITAKAPRRSKPGWSVGPVFSVEDPNARVLGRTGRCPSLAVKELGNWRSVYSLLPLTRELLAGLCRYAGVHVYSETFDPFFANKSFVMIHTASAGAKRIVLPGRYDVTEVLSGQPVGSGIRTIETDLPAGVTKIFRVAPH